jgi:Right handed beta helix region
MLRRIALTAALAGSAVLGAAFFSSTTTTRTPVPVPASRGLRTAAAMVAAAADEIDTLNAHVASLAVQLDRANAERLALQAALFAADAQISEIAAPASGSAPPSSPPPPRTCHGTAVSVVTGLSAAVSGAPAGTTFCLFAGVYSVPSTVYLEDGDVIAGQGSGVSVIQGTGADNVLSAMGDADVVVSDVTIRGGAGDSACAPACGRAIEGVGSSWTITDVECSDNDNQCLGGGSADITMIRIDCHDNGFDLAFTESGATRSAACVKRAGNGDGHLVVVDPTITHNGWNGVWADYDHGEVTIIGGVISGNVSAGVHIEITGGFDPSNGSTITGTKIMGNGDGDTFPARRTGLQCEGCANLTVAGVHFAANAATPFSISNDERAPWGAVFAVVIRDNTGTAGGDGCSLAGTICTGNAQ